MQPKPETPHRTEHHRMLQETVKSRRPPSDDVSRHPSSDYFLNGSAPAIVKRSPAPRGGENGMKTQLVMTGFSSKQGCRCWCETKQVQKCHSRHTESLTHLELPQQSSGPATTQAELAQSATGRRSGMLLCLAQQCTRRCAGPSPPGTCRRPATASAPAAAAAAMCSPQASKPRARPWARPWAGEPRDGRRGPWLEVSASHDLQATQKKQKTQG